MQPSLNICRFDLILIHKTLRWRKKFLWSNSGTQFMYKAPSVSVFYSFDIRKLGVAKLCTCHLISHIFWNNPLERSSSLTTQTPTTKLINHSHPAVISSRILMTRCVDYEHMNRNLCFTVLQWNHQRIFWKSILWPKPKQYLEKCFK